MHEKNSNTNYKMALKIIVDILQLITDERSTFFWQYFIIINFRYSCPLNLEFYCYQYICRKKKEFSTVLFISGSHQVCIGRL